MMCFRAARNAIIVLIASSMAKILYDHAIEPFTLTGNITSGIPPFKAPSFTLTDGNHTYTVQDYFEVSEFTAVCMTIGPPNPGMICYELVIHMTPGCLWGTLF